MKNINLKNIKNVQQLWNENHISFRKWMYAAISSIIFLSFLFLIQLLINIIFKDLIINSIQKNAEEIINNNAKQGSIPTNELILAKLLVQPLLLSIISIWTAVLFVLSFISGEKNKTYEKISGGVNLFTLIMTFFSIYQIIFSSVILISNSSSNNSSILLIIQTPTYIVYLTTPFLWGFVIRNITIIKRSFISVRNIEQMQQLMKDENIKKIFNMFNINIDENTKNDVSDESKDSTQNSSQNHKAEEVKKVDPILNKLETLTDEQLASMAEKLNIYDFANLSREELIKKIYENIKK
ncbi:hypothetical protein [Mycoplasma phocimorsus]|uniref:hypothetical protein n=1 Tax=Mycoplasma phocimorsus TaxID=3045839 RepID=UPI0024BF3A97|nr:hypothetical protein [Mycoplasma phocimorsus]MDJ1647486.1 hypothetical protein [Mycoplasma phocimorsus]MDJ1649098.1 hypothetical protein [Mycoplasma phocimorsus]